MFTNDILKQVRGYSKIWSGSFGCTDSNCQNKFSIQIYSCSRIENAVSGELIVKYEKISSHKSSLLKSLRCHGKNRTEQTETLVLTGITNTRNSNIIENERTSLKGKNKKIFLDIPTWFTNNT